MRAEAGVAVGICLANAGDVARAEGHLRAELAKVRGSGRPAVQGDGPGAVGGGEQWGGPWRPEPEPEPLPFST